MPILCQSSVSFTTLSGSLIIYFWNTELSLFVGKLLFYFVMFVSLDGKHFLFLETIKKLNLVVVVNNLVVCRVVMNLVLR